MKASMFFVYVTLANGVTVSGVVQAASYEAARTLISETEQAQTARDVVIERTY